ncbi:septum formation initiator family protein [Planosporangium thailandense]|uniref:Septum formation initiator family protein n=1 Tax=Planosporangium thailandense TaxID=765197 RepID=A0ABX0XW16_9ACTN|nr:septum formation initiator family protein [Planosporangium thailandense]NJC70243.1 septum formation initiator family protein [Planosporangium thailandense]
MPQRRTPSGQGPGARGGRDLRGGRRTGARSVGRDAGTRVESARSSGLRGSVRTGAVRTTASRVGGADGVRSSSRPAAARRAAGGGVAKRTRAPQPRRLTGRAAVLCMVLIGLLLAYAYPVRVYLSQQSEIDQLESRQAAQRARIADLSGRLEKWNDDEYVKAQARGRLLFTMPGEKPLLVIDKSQPQDNKPGKVGAVETPADGGADAGPWYGKLWSSVRAADQGAR